MVFKRKKSIGDYISDGVSAVSEKVGAFAHTRFDVLIDKIELRLIGLQDRIIKKFIYSLFFGVSIVFLSLGCFYFLKEYLLLTNTSSFMIIGILLLLIGIFIKSTERRYSNG